MRAAMVSVKTHHPARAMEWLGVNLEL
jgi:hypothetical protein